MSSSTILTDRSVKTLLETQFQSRMDSIKNLILSSLEKREKVKTDREFRSRYTNKSIHQRHQELNGCGAPPLLLRQYNILADTEHTDILEAKNNIQAEYNKKLVEFCNFSEEEIKYIINTHISSLSTESIASTIPILCTIGGVTYVLKYSGVLETPYPDIRGFFFTRFIMEDNIIPIFDKRFSFSTEGNHSVFLKLF
ncbi:MAG: hypothetical protein PHG66_00795 [Candidatus Colwellbacteria bacterium]|nr:hypothetical protein [Candidatus Colwellbacteria bacterium]